MDHRGVVDNTYATIQPRHSNHGNMVATSAINNGGMDALGSGNVVGMSRGVSHNEFADYATLRNNRAPSV